MEKDYSVNEDINQSIESRREDAFYSFDTSGTDERPSLKPIEERDFVQSTPDDPSIFAQQSVSGFTEEIFIVVVDGQAEQRKFLTQTVST